MKTIDEIQAIYESFVAGKKEYNELLEIYRVEVSRHYYNAYQDVRKQEEHDIDHYAFYILGDDPREQADFYKNEIPRRLKKIDDDFFNNGDEYKEKVESIPEVQYMKSLLERARIKKKNQDFSIPDEVEGMMNVVQLKEKFANLPNDEKAREGFISLLNFERDEWKRIIREKLVEMKRADIRRIERKYEDTESDDFIEKKCERYENQLFELREENFDYSGFIYFFQTHPTVELINRMLHTLAAPKEEQKPDFIYVDEVKLIQFCKEKINTGEMIHNPDNGKYETINEKYLPADALEDLFKNVLRDGSYDEIKKDFHIARTQEDNKAKLFTITLKEILPLVSIMSRKGTHMDIGTLSKKSNGYINFLK